jgi:diadenosine tetraphosphate (Ap4A) HIT family hydrolase
MFQLSEAEQTQLWKETTQLSQALSLLFKADKMNVAALGNVVSQLHMHVIVRHVGDAAWPAPVWGKHPAQPYSSEQAAVIVSQLKSVLVQDFTFAQEQS